MAQYSLYRPWAGDPWGSSFDDLRREMDALLGRFGGVAPSGRGGAFPATNLYDAGDAYVLTAELPGVGPGDIDVSIEGSTVAIRGERRIDHGSEGNVHRLERRSGGFRRAFELPGPVDSDKAEAIHKNGVLMLRVPKSAAHQPRQITVNAS